MDFDFGLTPGLFTFVAYDHFWEHDFHRFIVPHERVLVIYRGSHIVNNYRVVNGRVIHEGLGRERIALLTHREVKAEQLQEIRAREEHRNHELRNIEIAKKDPHPPPKAPRKVEPPPSPHSDQHPKQPVPHDKQNPPPKSPGKGDAKSPGKDDSTNKKANN